MSTTQEGSSMAISESVDQVDSDLETIVENLVDQKVEERLDEEKADLREENEHLRERVAELENEVDEVKDHSARERAKLSARVNQVEEDAATKEDVAELRTDLTAEQKTRSNHDTQIERRVNVVADKAGVEVSAADLAVDDKIAQLISVGPDAITDRVYSVHRRARALLENADDWGKKYDDKNGIRVEFVAPEVRPYLDTKFSRSFKTPEIARIFSKIEELAEDSPRRVKHGKTSGGKHMLRVGVLHEDDPLYWRDE